MVRGIFFVWFLPLRQGSRSATLGNAIWGIFAPLRYASVLKADRALFSVVTEANGCVAKRSKNIGCTSVIPYKERIVLRT
jgi:hypothetical protein